MSTTAPELSRDSRSPKVAVVIPARNEEATVGNVVAAAERAAGGRGDRGRQRVLRRHCGQSRPPGGPRGARTDAWQGEAVHAGVAATDAEIVVLLDADLVGLRPEHVDALVQALLDGAGMVCGLFDRGPLLNPLFVHALPTLTGERALRRELFEALTPDFVHGYRIEAGLNSLAKDRGLPAVLACLLWRIRARPIAAARWVLRARRWERWGYGPGRSATPWGGSASPTTSFVT